MLLFAVSCNAASVIPPIASAGFEDGVNGWEWVTFGGAKVSYKIDSTSPHSGKNCVVFTDGSPLAGDVYGRLRQNINVLPDTEYELSLYVRGEDVAEGLHITDWTVLTMNLPSGTYGWKKVSATFRTKPDQHVLGFGINVVNTCKAFAVDDIYLRPVGNPIKGKGIDGSFLVPPKILDHKAPGYMSIVLNSSLRTPVKLEAVISEGKTKVFAKSADIKTGENKIDWDWDSGNVPFGKMDCSIRVLDAEGAVIASANQQIEKASSPLRIEIDKSLARLDEFNKLYKECQAKKIRLDYPRVAKTMLEEFIPYAYEDAREGHDWRAQGATVDFKRSIDDGIALMQAYLKDPNLAPDVPRYQTGKLDINGLEIIGNRKDSDGKKDQGPLFFCGYGHFTQARNNMPRWPGYGINLIQSAEFGPSSVFPEEGKVDLTAAKTIAKAFDEAAKYNVKVDLLISPHYFPEWARKKYPNIAQGSGGWLNYTIDAPEAKMILEKFLRIVIPMFKDKPALNSFCLSNEPVFDQALYCSNTKQMWADYLKKIHGDVATMNARYGTNYTSFDEVNYPVPSVPQYYDYCRFIDERFAGWHKWMADIIHEMAPGVPTHAKIMSHTTLNSDLATWGLDPECFGEVSGFNGNDCYIVGGGGGWSINWTLQNLFYDIQRSLVKKPIFNSENHLTADCSTNYVAPEHFRTALWQGAVHGQGATTIWVWERTMDRGYPLYGNVKDRPGCAQAVGTTCLDLNRFSKEVTALQEAKTPVAILYSMASITHSRPFFGAVYQAYIPLNFCGVKVDFISDKQLAQGKGKDYKLIIFPQATHLTEDAFKGVRALGSGTRLLILGDGPSKNEYDKDLPAEGLNAIKQNEVFIDPKTDEPGMWSLLQKQLNEVNAQPDVQVVDAVSGKPIWGVEYLSAKVNGRTVLNIINLTEKQVEVKILKNGQQVTAKDLFSLGGTEDVKVIKPVTPILAEIR